jgi:hypothetical protein
MGKVLAYADASVLMLRWDYRTLGGTPVTVAVVSFDLSGHQTELVR